MLINIEPGDRVKVLSTGYHGVCQWVDFDQGEISVRYSDGGYTLEPLDGIEALITRVFKDPSEMSSEEMREEISLLRESRKLAVKNSRSRQAKTDKKSDEKRRNKEEDMKEDSLGIPAILRKTLPPEKLRKLEEQMKAQAQTQTQTQKEKGGETDDS